MVGMTLRFRYAGLVMALLALAVAVRAADPAPIARLRLMVFDTYQLLSPRTYDADLPVRIVHIDESSLKKFGQWPWPRSVLAALTNRLADSGAAVVAFDFVMAEPDRLLASEIAKWLPNDPAAALIIEQIGKLPSGDVAFANAIAAVPVVLGFIGTDDSEALPVLSSGFVHAGDDPRDFVPAFRGAAASLALLEKQSKGSGALNWVPEHDQVVRRLPLLVRLGDRLYPSFAAETLRIAQGATSYVVKASGASSEEAFGTRSGIIAVGIGQIEVPTDANGQMWLRFTRSDPRRIISAARLLDGVVGRSEIEGRIVLVGTSAAGLFDLRTTPLEASMTGVEVQAQAIEQMLLGNHLRRPDFATGAELVLLLFAGLTLAFVVYYTGALWSAVIGAAALIGAVASSWWAYKSFGLLFDPVYPAVSLTCLYLATTVYRYLQTETERKRVRDTFGRYLTDEVVDTLLDSPSGLQMGGEKREITMMMTDLRGFTSLSERLAPERVVAILNRYLATMVTIIKQYHGTIDEYIGDAIFVLFGAPIRQEDDAQRAVACAVAMQLAMDSLNEKNRQDDLPEVEMGIGIHTGQVVLGNIGSPEHQKYGVVGSHVNLTSRIQSYTIGGQILISESTRMETASVLRLGKQMEVKAKGIEHSVTVSEVLGIGGRHKLFLSETADVLVPLAEEIPLRYAIVEGAHLSGETCKGGLTKLAPKQAEARLENPVPILSNLKMHLLGAGGQEVPGALYGKVVEAVAGSNTCFSVHFTSMSPEIATFLTSQSNT
jgi:adenylate cyclase